MEWAADVGGPRSPLPGTPVRRLGSVRRTTNIDTVQTAERDSPRIVEARARDVSTGPDGRADHVGSAVLHARVEAGTYELVTLTSEPPDPRLTGLLGATVGPGFRRRLAEVLPSAADQRSLAYLLLDDLPGAQLVAGYNMVHQRDPDGDTPDRIPSIDISSRVDFCAGWAGDGALIEGFRRTSQIRVPVGPTAPRLESRDDEDGWHAMTPLPPGGMRRRRRLDVLPIDDGRHRFEAHFRDSHMSTLAEETVLHEYRVTGTVDAVTRTLVAVEAEALVLPYGECPNALGSVQQVVGWSLAELRRAVHRQLVGTSSCTHLNDTLRSLCNLDVLIDRQGGRCRPATSPPTPSDFS